jgi:hypothetical protein
VEDDPLAALATRLCDDPALEASLNAIDRAHAGDGEEAFVTAAAAAARGAGIALDEAAIRAGLRPHPPGMARFMPAPVTLDRWPGTGWLPARSVPTGGAPAIDWMWAGNDRLADPFYEEAVRRLERRPLSRLLRTRTDLAALVTGVASEAPAPDGFVFHLSRCGSTLIAQMLGADPDHVVLSEPEPLDAVLRWAVESDAPAGEGIVALRAVAAALTRDRTGTTRRRFVKLDSWHTAALPLLRAAFPQTPWVFVYRDPIEVLVSQIHRRGIHTVPGMLPACFVSVPDAEAIAPERYAALSLAGVAEAALAHRGVGGGIAVDYRELPGAVIDRIAPHFGFRPYPDQQAAMRAAATRDAKAPERAFVADGADKHRAATPAITAAACELLDPLHTALTAWRDELVAPTGSR